MTRWLLICTTLATLGCTPDAGNAGADGGQDSAATDPGDPQVDACELPGAAVGWSAESHAKGTPGDYARLFEQDTVLRMDITICAETADAMQADLDSVMADSGIEYGSGGGPPDGGSGGGGGPPDEGGGRSLVRSPAYVPVTVAFDGQTWPGVGMRYKGNSSLWGSYMEGVDKLPFRLEFDQFEDEYPSLEDQRFWGFKELKFSNGYTDDSLIRDVLAARSLQAAGVPAAAGAFVEIYVDRGDGPVYWGLYSMFENVCGEVLDTHFGDDAGNCYEAEDADLTVLGDGDFTNETNGEDGDWSDIQALVDVLADHSGTDAEWADRLDRTLDVDGYLRALAFNQLIGNWDSYGNMGHNYYLYADPGQDGRLVWIPWDHNMSYTTTSMQEPVDLDLEGMRGDWPLLERVRDNSETWAVYLGHIADLLDGPLAEDNQTALIQSLHDQIADSVARESAPYTNLSADDAFEDSLDNHQDGLFGRVAEFHAEGAALLAE